VGNSEIDRLIAELINETDHLKKWCMDADAGEPVCLCEEEKEQSNPLDCSHIAKGGKWKGCPEKCTVAPPPFATSDAAALEAIKALQDKGVSSQIRYPRPRHGGDFGRCQLAFWLDDSPGADWELQEWSFKDSLHEALVDALVEKHREVAGDPHEHESIDITYWRIKPALLEMLKRHAK